MTMSSTSIKIYCFSSTLTNVVT